MYHTFGGRCCMVSMSVLIAVGGLKIPHGFRVNCFSILKASKIWLAFVAFWAGRVSKNSSYESHAGFSREPNGSRHPNRFVVLSKMAWDIFNVFSFVFFSLLGKGWMFYRFGIPMLKNSECSSNKSNNEEKGGEPSEKEILYIRYDDKNMKFVYLCANCDTIWKTENK